jgi:holin-like protein
MLNGIAVLLFFQLVGEIASFQTGGRVPGPVIGLALFAFLTLLTKRRSQNTFERLQTAEKVSDTLLANLGILFVPAGVGISQNLNLFAERGVQITLVIMTSTIITLAVTVWTFIFAKKFQGLRKQQ